MYTRVPNESIATLAVQHAQALARQERLGYNPGDAAWFASACTAKRARVVWCANELIRRACVARRAELNATYIPDPSVAVFDDNSAEYVALLEWEDSLGA